MPISKFKVDQSAAGKEARTILHRGKRVLCGSKAEARKLAELALLERAGKIRCLMLHPELNLKAASTDGLPKVVARYVADAMFEENGRDVVYEVKGSETAEWRLKRKWFLACYPTIELRVVKV